jgi:hypothetical protein
VGSVSAKSQDLRLTYGPITLHLKVESLEYKFMTKDICAYYLKYFGQNIKEKVLKPLFKIKRFNLLKHLLTVYLIYDILGCRNMPTYQTAPLLLDC